MRPLFCPNEQRAAWAAEAGGVDTRSIVQQVIGKINDRAQLHAICDRLRRPADLFMAVGASAMTSGHEPCTAGWPKSNGGLGIAAMTSIGSSSGAKTEGYVHAIQCDNNAKKPVNNKAGRCKLRNRSEIMFARLQLWQSVATRYGR